MNSQGVIRLLTAGFLADREWPFASSDTPSLIPAADDTPFYIGNGTKSFDLRVYGSAAAAYISWDASADDLKFEDSVSLMFGTGAGAGQGNAGDVEMRWDGTDFDILPAVDDSIMKVGNGTLSFDFWLYGGAAATYISWDASADSLKLEDSVYLGFGSNTAGPGSLGDINITWNGTKLLVAQAAADSTIDWGVSGAGINHVFYGDTATLDLSWDQTNNQLLFNDNAKLALGTGAGAAGDVVVYWDSAKLMAASLTAGVWVNPTPVSLDPNFATSVYEIFDDFFEFDPTATVGNWVVIEDDAADTQTLSDTVGGGVLVLTNKATTDDDAQQITGVASPIRLAAGKHVWFEARVRCAAGATQIDLIVGLCQGNTVEDMTGVSDNRFQDGIGFFKNDGATTIQFGSSKDGTDTGTNTNVGTLTTGWHTLGFYVNGLTSATPYVDGVAGTAITATFCDDENLTPIFMVRNGDATTTQTLEVDYVRVLQLR